MLTFRNILWERQKKLQKWLTNLLLLQELLLHWRTSKIISFGPRPANFLACNAPIKRLYDLGVEIEENSELDLFEAFNKHANDPRIPDVVKEMEAELGEGNMKPEILPKLAQYEITLLDWVEAHKGSRNMWHLQQNAGLHFRHNSDLFHAM